MRCGESRKTGSPAFSKALLRQLNLDRVRSANFSQRLYTPLA
jgi:hypothetical protein